MKMNKKLLSVVVSAVMTLVILSGKAEVAMAAVTPITVDEDEYNVYIEDYPSGIATLYAKFNSPKSNVEEYALSLYDDYESEEIMAAALTKTGKSIDDYTLLAMDITLYQADADDEFYPVNSNMDMTVICEVPSEFMDLESKVNIFAVTDTGRVENIQYTLVDVDDVICMKFSINRFTHYAFAVTNADIEDYENRDNDEDNVDESASTPNPTAKPTSTPSPTKGAQTNVNNSSTSTGKDSVPKTGDDFSMGLTSASVGVASILLLSAIIYLKKK